MPDITGSINPETKQSKPWLYLVIVLVYLFFFCLLGNLGDVDEGIILSMDPVLLLTIQGATSAILFVGFAVLFIGVVLKKNIVPFFPRVSMQTLGLTFLITLSFFVVNSMVGEWNLSINFPSSSFEAWARTKEEQLKVLTEHLTNFTSGGHFILAFVVIAIIPAIGEEMLFRGLVQNLFDKTLGNHHLAIWLTGFLFAAIHMQFYGLFPRMLLGALFGYLYHWSGKLTVAMVAHFVNNGVALLIYYLYQQDTIEIAPEQMEQSAPWPVLLVFAITGSIAMYLFYTKHWVRHE